ncbi:molybdopterin-guanine dinucleotide biosynthesis protein B [Salicibibacter kimchii]|uniref:Molybdopterin-guanine dinucleotide biosynthesis protein B n=1 Tax=Salicibibacter kimchii TaxID=2099786 RepID=A0A345C157_9BACI|nr:molybdopterin-guanine dinucleotide biosynthesis protein B [Salicibibacter kimchii]AXF56938.1 molybdopterin-guanine dinucleotide biosynthesis protein B [Salicibibacter kimchii]
MGKHCRVLQVVGYKNSGKTTLMEELVEVLSARGISVAALKHHGHGGTPVSPELSTDSERFFQAGAMASAVEGDGVLRLSAAHDEWSLGQLLRIQAGFGPDVILVEGWKHAGYPKVVLLRGREDNEILSNVTNVCCVLYRGEKPRAQLPSFSLDKQPRDYLQWIVDKVEDSHGFKFV